MEVSTAATAEALVVKSMCITSDGFWKLMVELGVKAEPAQPQHEQTDYRKGHIVPRNGAGLAVPAVLADTGPQQQRAGKRRPAAHGMYGGITGEILKAQLCQPAAAPYPVSYYGVYNKGEYKGKHYEGDVFDSFRHCSGNYGSRRAAENQLKEYLAPERHIRGKRIGVEGIVGIAQYEQVACADKGVISAEHETPAQKQEAQ